MTTSTSSSDSSITGEEEGIEFNSGQNGTDIQDSTERIEQPSPNAVTTTEELLGGIDHAAARTLSVNMSSYFKNIEPETNGFVETSEKDESGIQVRTDNRIPSDLLPYKKDKITVPFCRTVYCYRHLFSGLGVLVTVGRVWGNVWGNMRDVTDYQTELAVMYQQVIIEGRRLYKNWIVKVAPSLGILRGDKQACMSWGEVEKWAIRAENHLNKEIQFETVRKLIKLFHCKLDSPGNVFG
jgi:hypothetical protein